MIGGAEMAMIVGVILLVVVAGSGITDGMRGRGKPRG
jgi:hypothetical protein